jgi:hypothetical protein
MPSDIAPRIIAAIEKALAEQIQDLTAKRFTGTLSITLDCAFREGGLRNVHKEISRREQEAMKADTYS